MPTSLTLAGIPGFTEIPDANFNTGAAITEADMQALNGVAKFAAVRNEQFGGYYKNGETVALPVSPADAYTYARSELMYVWSPYASESAGGACNGTTTPPARGSTTGDGTVLQLEANVDPATGLVYARTSYFKSAQQDRNDGILWVVTLAQRLR